MVPPKEKKKTKTKAKAAKAATCLIFAAQKTQAPPQDSGTLALDLAMMYASLETEAAKSCFGPYKASAARA